MAHQVIELECPGCGVPITTSTQTCPQCFRPIVISTFNSVSSMSPLDIKLYDKALPCFEKAIEDNFDNSEVYFYAAITLLKGKKAFLTPRTVIDKAEEYLNAAIMIEPKSVYYYFWAYLRYDHHFRKHYVMNPNYKTLLNKAIQIGLSQTDVQELYSILEVERPNEL